jgi:RNA polymerase sigma factor (sigma-70 family)
VTPHDLAEQNLGLIGFVIRKWHRHLPPEEQDEAYQDGYIGLLRAAEKFDPQKGWAFSTYAVFWVRRFIMQGREEREGINYRRAVRAGSSYLEPKSLSTVLGDGIDLADTLIAAEDVEATVGRRVLAAQVAARATRMCADDIDRAALARLTGEGETLVAAEARLGVSRQTVLNRQNRMRNRLAYEFGGAA